MDGENSARLLPALEKFQSRHHAVVVINCMPELMRRTRMGKLDFGRMLGGSTQKQPRKSQTLEVDDDSNGASHKAEGLLGRVGAWMGEQARAHRTKKARSHTQYLKLVDRLPGLLRFLPSAGRLRDVKHYLHLFCYFLQPTPANIRSMVLYALKHYVPDQKGRLK